MTSNSDQFFYSDKEEPDADDDADDDDDIGDPIFAALCAL